MFVLRTRRMETLDGLLVRFKRALNRRRFAMRFVAFRVCLDTNRNFLRLLLLRKRAIRSTISSGKFFKLLILVIVYQKIPHIPPENRTSIHDREIRDRSLCRVICSSLRHF